MKPRPVSSTRQRLLRVWFLLASVLMVIALLASECAAVLPVQ